MVGGYVVIDLKNVLISKTSVKIPGIYDKIEASFGKPILLRNINMDRKEVHSTYCVVSGFGTSFLLAVSFSTQGVISFVQVDQDDNVKQFISTAPTQSGDEPFSGEDGPSASM